MVPKNLNFTRKLLFDEFPKENLDTEKVSDWIEFFPGQSLMHYLHFYDETSLGHKSPFLGSAQLLFEKKCSIMVKNYAKGIGSGCSSGSILD